MSQVLPADTTSGTVAAEAPTSVPTYLVNWEMPLELSELVKQGEFSRADQWLHERAAAEPAKARAYSDERQRLQRMLRDFDVPAEGLLAKIQRQIPDATLEDVEKWRQSGALQWLAVEGQVRYFRREPSNLFLFEQSAKLRRTAQAHAGNPAAAKEDELTRHCAAALAAANSEGTTLPLPMTFHVKHTITIKPGAVPAGETIRCWMPYPQAYRQQQEPRLIAASPAHPQIAPNGSPMRTLYFEQKAGAAGTTFTAEYEYRTSAFVPGLDGSSGAVGALAEDEQAQHLRADPPHVQFTPEIRELSAKLVGNETDPLKKAYVIWSWIDENIRWAAEIEYAVLPNIVRKVLACRRGDCGTQALLFISLCRAADVPARWQSGWVMRPKHWNLHDWAEFYSDKHGWLPADPSIGRRKSGDPAVRDFLFGHVDSYRMIANLDFGQQFVPAKQHLRSDPVDNQRGEVEWRGGNLYFDDWSYEVDVEAK